MKPKDQAILVIFYVKESTNMFCRENFETNTQEQDYKTTSND